jgi:catechol 2,3-dioxygenase-like lactoylglutathione lyase family enzyme
MTAYRTDHIALLVRDLDEELAFLIGVLGLTEGVNPMGGTTIRWIEIGDGRRFHVQAGDVSRVHVEKQTHFALSTPDFDTVVADFTQRGIVFSDMKGTLGAINTRPDGMRALFLQSPTGYWFEINDWKHS